MSIPDDNPVYTHKKVMEELDFTKLLAKYSNKGRNGYNPTMKYAVLTYANMYMKKIKMKVTFFTQDGTKAIKSVKKTKEFY